MSGLLHTEDVSTSSTRKSPENDRVPCTTHCPVLHASHLAASCYTQPHAYTVLRPAGSHARAMWVALIIRTNAMHISAG